MLILLRRDFVVVSAPVVDDSVIDDDIDVCDDAVIAVVIGDSDLI